MFSLPQRLAVLFVAFLLIGLGAFTIGYVKGESKGEIAVSNYSEAAEKRAFELAKKNTEISNKVVTKYVDKVKVVKQKEYVYVQSAENLVPSLVTMSNGWVYTHDSSASASDADPARASDATSSGVKDNQALATIVSNYSACRQNSEQLIALQEWVKQNLAEINKGK
jgi:hypothetical protein